MNRIIRPIRIEGDIAYVTLTRGYEAIIDATDVPVVEGRNWHVLLIKRKDGAVRTAYACHTLPRDVEGKQKHILIHRVLMGDPVGLVIDHIDSDGLNCRRANMREATKSQNCHNQRQRFDNTSNVKGVHFCRRMGKYIAQIAVNGKKHHLGIFITMKDAADAYARANRDLHGKFGRLA